MIFFSITKLFCPIFPLTFILLSSYFSLHLFPPYLLFLLPLSNFTFSSAFLPVSTSFTPLPLSSYPASFSSYPSNPHQLYFFLIFPPFLSPYLPFHFLLPPFSFLFPSYLLLPHAHVHTHNQADAPKLTCVSWEKASWMRLKAERMHGYPTSHINDPRKPGMTW